MSILKNLNPNKKGFTLVELLVVIAIIGVLATLILLQLGAAREKSRDAKRVADINQVRSGIELFFDDNSGRYPNSSATLWENLVNTGRYMTLLPVDPLAGSGCGSGSTANYNGAGCYGYAWSPNATPLKFHIWAELERKSTAHGADVDSNTMTGGLGFSGTAVNGAAESCADNNVSNQNCVYDVGVTQ